MKFLKKYIFAVLAAVLALGAGNAAMAEDELYLCGIVKDVDSQDETVIIDVKSESCRGIRTFRLSVSMNIASFQVNREKCFFINSNVCNAKEIYSIIKD